MQHSNTQWKFKEEKRKKHKSTKTHLSIKCESCIRLIKFIKITRMKS